MPIFKSSQRKDGGHLARKTYTPSLEEQTIGKHKK